MLTCALRNLGVDFAPVGAGAQAGSLSITSSTAGAAGSVSLTGTGFDFSVAASGSTTATVSNGQTADYIVAITPTTSAGGTFAFACGTLPANAICLFNPNTESLNAGVTGNVTVGISVGGAGTSARLKRTDGLIPVACVLLLLPLGWATRRKALRCCLLLAVLAAGVSSCTSSGGGTGGGGSTGGGSTGDTPTGTYSIPVNVTSNGVEHSLTLTLTVY